MTPSLILPATHEDLHQNITALFELLARHPHYDLHEVAMTCGETVRAFRLASDPHLMLIDDHTLAIQVTGTASHTRIDHMHLSRDQLNMVTDVIAKCGAIAAQPVQQQHF